MDEKNPPPIQANQAGVGRNFGFRAVLNYDSQQTGKVGNRPESICKYDHGSNTC